MKNARITYSLSASITIALALVLGASRCEQKKQDPAPKQQVDVTKYTGNWKSRSEITTFAGTSTNCLFSLAKLYHGVTFTLFIGNEGNDLYWSGANNTGTRYPLQSYAADSLRFFMPISVSTTNTTVASGMITFTGALVTSDSIRLRSIDFTCGNVWYMFLKRQK